MPRLFYKDMRAHETAYRHQIADEATNDLLLGAKVSAYTGFETAKEKSIDEIATNYGKFLKALQTKEIPLTGVNIEVSKKEAEAKKKAEDVIDALSSTNTLMPSSQRPTEEPISQSDSERNSLFTGLNPNETPQQTAVKAAYNIAQNTTSVASALSHVKSTLKPAGLDKNLEDILHMTGFRASTGKQKRGRPSDMKPLTMTALQQGMEALWNGVSAPTQ